MTKGGGPSYLAWKEHHAASGARSSRLVGHDGSNYYGQMVTSEGEAVVTGGAMEVLSTGELSVTQASGNTISVPANAWGGVIISSVSDSPSIVYVSFGASPASDYYGHRIFNGSTDTFLVRDTTIQLQAPLGDAAVYYTILGAST